MPKKARKPEKKVWVHRPPPTQTPHEIMSMLDAANMVSLLGQVFSCMPPSFKDLLRERGFLQFSFADYDILITSKKKFDRPIGAYGKARYGGDNRAA
ncbi:hypothetical protein LCGC14_2507760 [marine sediment metagenome]|uniref:Uncharacterized protein n=1 Tax=marine sediment metagenome TaxID=412755 RepID=A0A0F9B0T9_9ZZZZ